MTKFLLAVCLLACTLGAFADEEIKKEEGVLVLTEKNFDQVTKSDTSFLINSCIIIVESHC